MSNHETLCKNRWTFPSLNLATREVRTCVRYIGDVLDHSAIQQDGYNFLLNNPHQKQRRLNMLKGVKQKDCAGCYMMEKSGSKSPRGGYNDFVDYQSKVLNKPKDKIIEMINSVDENSPLLESHFAEVLEVSIGNLCNFKCVYCDLWSSSRWANEALKFNDITPERYKEVFPEKSNNVDLVNSFWDWFEKIGKHSVQYLFIIGGEPTISDDFYNFMGKLSQIYTESGLIYKCSVNIITNLGVSSEILEKLLFKLNEWSKVFEIDFNISFESYQERCEFIRYGMNWNQFEKNLNHILNFAPTHNKFKISSLPTFSSLSVSSTPQFLRFLLNKAKKYNRKVTFKLNQAMNPPWQSTLILTPDFCKYLDASLLVLEEFYKEIPELMGCYEEFYSYIKSISKALVLKENSDVIYGRTEFILKIDQLNVRRNLNFLSTFPEYKEIYDFCKQIQSEKNINDKINLFDIIVPKTLSD